MAIENPPGAVVATNSSRTVWIAGSALALASIAAVAGIALRPGNSAPQVPAASLTQGESTLPSAKSATTNPAAPQHAKVPATPAPSTKVAVACANCGVIESVVAVQRKGQGTGVGAVAGGVLGAAVGNQMGHGNGRAAMTVLGAVGGGLAGNEVEKRARSETVFQVRVRMEDGTVRTLEQIHAPAIGERVIVQGNTLKAAA